MREISTDAHALRERVEQKKKKTDVDNNKGM